jgi:hypothetical protein
MQAKRFFNNSGPVNESDHFCVAPIKRLDTNKVWQLILQKKYFLICGPKQCGKTSYLLTLAKALNRKGYVKCLYFNVESLRGVQENLEESIRSVLFEISSRARDTFGDDYLEDLVPAILERRGPYQALNELLTQWSKRSDKPIVLLIDEIDTIRGQVLTSFLSQIRAGYDKRPALFPQSIVFCATHDVIDKQFNIKDATLKISALRREDLGSLFSEYTALSGVGMGKDAIDRIWRYSSGQPWIISTLASELFHEIAPAKGISQITADQVEEAFDNVIAKKGNHMEYLVSELRDERVKSCLVPILTSGSLTANESERDFTYIQELGLVKADKAEIANELYLEMIPRALIDPISYMLNLDPEAFLREDGRTLDSMKLLRTFQAFFRNHIDRLVALIDYGAAGYVLAFQALLQKFADANDRIVREFGLGQGRVVLRLERRYPERQVIVFMLEQARVGSVEWFKPLIPQLAEDGAAYLAKRQADGDAEMHVVAINTNPEFEWEGRSPCLTKEVGGKSVRIWGF